MSKKLENKVAIITGSTSGIGEAIAQLFAKEGAKIVVSGRNIQRGNRVVEDILRENGEAIFIRADVSIEEDIKNLIKKTIDHYKTIDILVNNAGGSDPEWLSEIQDMKNEMWHQIIRLNLDAVYWGTKHAIPYMLKKSYGVILTTSSGAAIVGQPALSHYCSAKAGVNGFTRAIAVEYAKRGIRANAILPGLIETPALKKAVQANFDDPEAQFQVIAETANPMGRLGNPKEIAATALFLASDDASFITGQSIVVDGGRTIS